MPTKSLVLRFRYGDTYQNYSANVSFCVDGLSEYFVLPRDRSPLRLVLSTERPSDDNNYYALRRTLVGTYFLFTRWKFSLGEAPDVRDKSPWCSSFDDYLGRAFKEHDVVYVWLENYDDR